MTSLDDKSKPPPRPAEPLTAQKIDFAYSIFWTKLARTWGVERRRLMAGRVASVVTSPGFEANALERNYRIEGLDDLAHSGASLLALQKVLEALGKAEAQG
ncbi:MAG: hypothetical protein HYZ49_03895 [Chloroflexi bacterium]|nr:hypothetical protein [Chloroflexota bacterium]